MYTRILVPIDLENVDHLENALALASKTAQEHDATVVFTNVVDAIPTTSPITEGEKVADKLHAFAQAQTKLRGIRATEQVTLRGDLSLNLGKDIIATAKEQTCDLIIMASHVPGLKDHILSSHAGYVASHAPMSVYVIR